MEASYAKLFCSRRGRVPWTRPCRSSAAHDFIKEFPVERMYRDVKGIEFGAGTTQIQKLIIIRELLKQMAGG